MRKDRAIIVRIDSRIITSPLLRVDDLLSSKSIWLGAEMARTEMDDEIEG